SRAFRILQVAGGADAARPSATAQAAWATWRHPRTRMLKTLKNLTGADSRNERPSLFRYAPTMAFPGPLTNRLSIKSPVKSDPCVRRLRIPAGESNSNSCAVLNYMSVREYLAACPNRHAGTSGDLSRPCWRRFRFCRRSRSRQTLRHKTFVGHMEWK